MLTGYKPFDNADKKDEFYSLIAKQKFDKFWTIF